MIKLVQAILLAIVLIYFFYMFRSTVKQEIELFDMFHLSSFTLVPVIFLLHSHDFITKISSAEVVVIATIAFVFLEMYIFTYRSVVRLHKLEKKVRTLTQSAAFRNSDNQYN